MRGADGSGKDTRPPPPALLRRPPLTQVQRQCPAYLGRSKRLQQYKAMLPGELCNEKSRKRLYTPRQTAKERAQSRTQTVEREHRIQHEGQNFAANEFLHNVLKALLDKDLYGVLLDRSVEENHSAVSPEDEAAG